MLECIKRYVSSSLGNPNALFRIYAGRPTKLDMCTVTQDGKRSFSFLSQALGLMADLDFGELIYHRMMPCL